jgi:hypothetical protein
MDTVKRAASRLRRMQGVLAYNYTPTIYDEPFGARELAIPGQGA